MRGWHIGRIAGIDIEIHFTWLLIFGLFLWSLSTSHFPQVAPRASSLLHWLAGLIATALFFGSLLLHELAHCLVAQRDGLKVQRITLFVFGGLAQLTDEPRTALSELRIAVAGPLTSLILGLLLWRGALLIPPTTAPLALARESLYYVGLANFFLSAFNILPAFPLDGGRILRSALWFVWRDIARATGVAAALGRMFGYGLGGVGIWLAVAHGRILDGLWLVFLGWLLGAAAEQAYQRSRIAAALDSITVADYMSSPAITVRADLPLSRFAHDYDFMLRHGAYPVVDQGRVVGMVHRDILRKTPRQLWPVTRVGDIMEALDMRGMVVDADEPLDAALGHMLASGRRRLMVMGPHRKLVGILSHSDVMRALRDRQHRAQAENKGRHTDA